MPHDTDTVRMTSPKFTPSAEMVACVAEAAGEAGAEWINEPLPRMAYEDIARAALAIAIPLIAGEAAMVAQRMRDKYMADVSAAQEADRSMVSNSKLSAAAECSSAIRSRFGIGEGE